MFCDNGNLQWLLNQCIVAAEIRDAVPRLAKFFVHTRSMLRNWERGHHEPCVRVVSDRNFLCFCLVLQIITLCVHCSKLIASGLVNMITLCCPLDLGSDRTFDSKAPRQDGHDRFAYHLLSQCTVPACVTHIRLDSALSCRRCCISAAIEHFVNVTGVRLFLYCLIIRKLMWHFLAERNLSALLYFA